VTNPLFTLYIISQNYGKFVDQAIQSVVEQSFADWELFLIDNGSNDNSYEIMNRYTPYSNIECLQVDDLSIAKIANLVISKARGKYIMRLDADDFLDSRALEIFLIELKKNSTLDMIFPDYFLVNEDGNILSLEIRESLPSIDSYKSIPPNGACSVWKLDTLKQIGGYDERLSAQDGLDVWIRANENLENFAFLNLNLPLFYYRRHGQNLTTRHSRIFSARQSIKRRHRSSDSKGVLALIPCRSRFDFVSNSWSLSIDGSSTLLEQSIRELSQSEYVNEIVVAGDSLEIQNETETLAKRYSKVPISFFYRNNIVDIKSRDLFNFLKTIQQDYEVFSKFEVFVIKFPLAPFVTADLIDEVVDTMQFEGTDSSCLVTKISGAVLKRGRFGVDLLSLPSNVNSFYESYFRHSNSLFALRADNLLKNSLWGSSTSYIEGLELSDFVIDSEVKLRIAKGIT
jgi:glycosyltransferase involved in cell wall biosynthesis